MRRLNLHKTKEKKYLKSIFGINFLLFYLIIPLCIIFFLLINFEKKTNFIFNHCYNFFSKLINHNFVLKINKIKFSGLNNLDEAFLLKHTGLKTNISIFQIDLDLLRKKIIEIEIVSEVLIERILPNTLSIKIKEKNPVGFVQNNDNYQIITDDGSIISKIKIHNSSNLPIFVGKNSEKRAHDILVFLNKVIFNEEIWSIELVKERRWNLNLKKGITILLPEKNIEESLIKLMNLDKKYNILDGNFLEIDLRNDEQLIFQPLVKLNQSSKVM